jgi:cytochrome c-type biogenesis protein
MEITLAAAILAGIVSFISPCVLPVVPAYLGQLGILAVTPPKGLEPAVAGVRAGSLATATAGAATLGPPRAASWRDRPAWRVLPHSLAFVLGFTAVFTVLGMTVYVAAGPIRDLTIFRQLGGLVLIVLGLNMAGVLRLSALARSWRPLDGPFGTRRARGGRLGALILGAVFAVGWTPCIGPTLGAILTLSAFSPGPEVVLLLVGYSLGLGVPFVALALAVDRAPAITRPLLRHARLIEIVGGTLVVLIGLAILFDWLAIFARAFSFLWPRV